MTYDAVYGFPCVENPHDFEPDIESCTDAEIQYHAEAKRRWDRGERDVRGSRCHNLTDEEGNIVGHVTATSWGIGINIIRGGKTMTFEYSIQKDGLIVIRDQENPRQPFAFTYHEDHAKIVVNALNHAPEAPPAQYTGESIAELEKMVDRATKPL